MYSSPDMLALVGELFTRRASMVIGKMAKAEHIPVKTYLDRMPKHAQEGLKVMRTLHERYRRGDYQHTEMEVGRIEQLCNWLASEWQNAGGHPFRPVKLEEAKMASKTAGAA